MTTKDLIKLQINDVPIGTPIAWTIFDEDGNIAYRPGFTFRHREELVTISRATVLFRADPRTGSADVPAAAASKRAPIADAEENETSLDDISLHIGEAWQLQPLSAFDQHRYYVKLVGYMKGASVIVTTPTVDGKALLIRDGQPFIVRAFSGKSAYAFKTSVIKSLGSPFPYLHLGYPDSVRGMIVRESQRITVNIIAAVTPARVGLEKSAGLIKNVSKSGASLQTPSAIGKTGDQLELAFQLHIDGNDYLLTLKGILRAVRPGGAKTGEATEYGIQFIETKPIDQLVLGAFVNSLIANADTA